MCSLHLSIRDLFVPNNSQSVQHGPCQAQATIPGSLALPPSSLSEYPQDDCKRRQASTKKEATHWRKPEDVELGEEIRDLRRDVALHSEAESGAKGDQTQAPDKHPGTQERDKVETERPKDKVNDFGQESIECDIASPNISARGIRALNRAGRFARLDAAQAPTTQANPKKSNSGQDILERNVASPNITGRGTGALNRPGGRIAARLDPTQRTLALTRYLQRIGKA
jgi:hypothetical protein